MMKKLAAFLIISTVFFLVSCSGPSDKELGEAALVATPTVFLISLGFQYLFFRLWKVVLPELTLSWLPNLIFYVGVLILAGLVGNGNPFWFLTDDFGWAGIVFIIFGPSFLTMVFIVMRIWLFVNPSNVFTWVSIAVMSFYVLLALPMVAGVTEGTHYVEFAGWFWAAPGTVLSASSNYGWPGSLTVLVFLILVVEVLIKIRTRRKGNA